MKKKIGLIGLSIFSLLMSCSSTSKIECEIDNTITSDSEITALNNYVTPLNSETLDAKLTNEDSFCFILYTDECPSCNAVKPYIISYICLTQYIIYGIQVNGTGGTTSQLEPVLNKIYEFDGVYVPRIYFVKDGQNLAIKNGFYQSEQNQKSITKLFNTYLTSKITK